MESRMRVMKWACVCGVVALASACGYDQPEPIPGKTPTPVKMTTPHVSNSSNAKSNNATPDNNTPSNSDARVGDTCAAKSDCDASHICDTTIEGGYCRPTVCALGCVGSGGACVSVGGHGGQCWATCEEGDSAREGLRCAVVGEESVLLPEDLIGETFDFTHLEESLEIRCDSVVSGDSDFGETRTFDFDIGAEANGFLMVPFDATQEVRPISLTTPNGEVIDLIEGYRHHNARFADGSLQVGGVYGAVGFSWAIGVPYAPQFEQMLREGSYTLEVAGPESMCFYVVESGGSQVVDLNLYFANVSGLSAVNAPLDEDFQDVLARMNEIYAQQGIALGEVRYFNLPEDVAAKYTVVRSLVDIRDLVGFGRALSGERAPNLSVDVFMVASITLQGGNILGYSGGVPGPAGLHGSASNGLVFNSSLIGTDNETVAHIMAHEIGHYMGLRHTTEFVTTDAEGERLIGLTDPLDDTPECPNVIQLNTNCPDSRNLMFPAAPFSKFLPTVTGDQGFALQRSALTK